MDKDGGHVVDGRGRDRGPPSSSCMEALLASYPGEDLEPRHRRHDVNGYDDDDNTVVCDDLATPSDGRSRSPSRGFRGFCRGAAGLLRKLSNLIRRGKFVDWDGGEIQRDIIANDSVYNSRFNYANNHIKTSKYTLLTFPVLNLLEQFQRLANFYFLCLFIMQLIPVISPLTPVTTALPLIGVLSVTAIKDAYDDIQRHKTDRQVNNRKSKVLRKGCLVDEKWHRVQVGDVIRMESNHFIAADTMILSSANPNGLCYIETAELDGETNLKTRQCLEVTNALGDNELELSQFNGHIVCEAPNNNLSKFDGTMSWRGQKYSLDNEHILLRGTVLRNTAWCYGVVVFAGKDTKLMQNSGKTKLKRTSIDRLLNFIILGIVFFLLCMCLFCTIACGVWETLTGVQFQIYLPWDSLVPRSTSSGATVIALLVFFSYAIVLNTVVPISLYVSVEIIRLSLSFLINWDLEMYDHKTDTPASAKTTTLNEELGQIQYIFSDKTGTLTQNIMTFNKCSIHGRSYGVDPGNEPSLSLNGAQVFLRKVDFSSNPMFEPSFEFYDQSLLNEVRRGNLECQEFFRLLALCHTVMPEINEAGNLEYQAQSPDENALVSAARNFGFVFTKRTPRSITIAVNGQEETYELLCILDFNNVRKRMSVILKRNGKIRLYCKGADTVIFERLAPHQEALKETTSDHLDRFASDGLRTLVVGIRDLTEQEFERWKAAHHEAAISMVDREGKLDAVYNQVENNLELLGATAIEDKLQDGVAKTISNLSNAGIKIWVLTGDKQETAVNIGYSCQLLTDELYEEPFIIDGETLEEVEAQIRHFKTVIDEYCGQSADMAPGGSSANEDAVRKHPPRLNESMSLSTFSNTSNDVSEDDIGISPVNLDHHHHHAAPPAGGAGLADRRSFVADAGNADGSKNLPPMPIGSPLSDFATSGGQGGFALVVNGHSLVHALSESLEMAFLRLAENCISVICCRVTPLQKALVVELVKKHKKAVTLAVGDGANDVSMIKTAHIGVGISGQEGMQAVLASDYSISQFRFLERLILVHGRWSYYRMCKFLRYFFYKNFAFTLCHFWYAFFCGFSGSTLFEPMFIAVYNLFYTSQPVLALGIFDQDVNAAMSLKFPKLYTPGQYSTLFNKQEFFRSALQGFITSCALFFVNYGAYYDRVDIKGLTMSDYMTFGTVTSTSLVVIVTAQIALDTSYWTVFNHITIWGSLLVYFIIQFLFNYIFGGQYFGTLEKVMSDQTFWFACALTTIILTLPVIAFRFFKSDAYPTLTDKVRLLQSQSKVKPKDELRPFSGRRSRRSVRSGYAFAHQEGFGRLITSGRMMRTSVNQQPQSSKSQNDLGGITKSVSRAQRLGGLEVVREPPNGNQSQIGRSGGPDSAYQRTSNGQLQEVDIPNAIPGYR